MTLYDKKMGKRTGILLIVALPLLIYACIGPQKPGLKVSYYTLEYSPPVMTGLAPLPYAIRIHRFSVDPAYNSNRIIYRDASFKRDVYHYHKWVDNPGDLVAAFLGRDIKGGGLFKGVLSDESDSAASYRVEGSVDEFLEWDTDSGWDAVLALSITLMAEREPDPVKKIIFQKGYRTEKPCTQKNPQGLAEAMSRAMEELSKEIITDIYTALPHAQ